MPGAGTHATIIQRLAKVAHDRGDPAAQFLTDPNLNADWTSYATDEALQGRYAVLGSMGPDIFMALLDYGDDLVDLEGTVVKILGTFRCVSNLSEQVNTYIDSTLDDFTHDAWSELQRSVVLVKDVIVSGLIDAVVSRHNFWSFYLPLRQLDAGQERWYWADYLHYVKTGCFTQKLLDNAAALGASEPGSQVSKCMGAYALGYLTHYVGDTTGHPWVNRIVESPYRNSWQRHHLIENFIDAQVWASWHDTGAPPSRPGDEDNLDVLKPQAANPSRAGAAGYVSSRLHDLCNIGSAGVDPIVDAAVTAVCRLIQQGLFDFGVSSVPTIDAPDDPLFRTWTEFVADAIYQTYPPNQPHPMNMTRYPTGADVATAYGAYRLLLSLQTEDEVEPPMLPDIAGDLSAILDEMWKKISADLGSVPPPPQPTSSGTFSVQDLVDAIKAVGDWFGQVVDAAVDALGDFFDGLIDAGVALAADTIKAGLYVLNSALYSAYHALRTILVMSGYAGPTTADLTSMWGTFDLSTLWTTADETANPPSYPIEPVVSERDLATDSSHPFSPYRPYMKPSTMAPVNLEQPTTNWPAQVLAWTMPEDMTDSGTPATHDMFSTSGPAPATMNPLDDPNTGRRVANLKTFDGSQQFFGSIMANCERALTFAVPYLNGTAYPAGVLLPDYNLDADRGYAWPAWDVDWDGTPVAWNGCDPYPADTLARGKSTTRAGVDGSDPFGGTSRSGTAWVNAAALSTPGNCGFGDFLLPSFIVNPKPGAPKVSSDADRCTGKDMPAVEKPGGGLLGPDYLLAPDRFLHSDVTDTARQDDVVDIYLRLPYTGATTKENDGRLHDFLRAAAASADSRVMLATALSVRLGGATPAQFGDVSAVSAGGPDEGLSTALAQLAVTGRRAFDAFSTWTPQGAPQDQDLVDFYGVFFSGSPFTAAQIADAATLVLDDAYRALWAIRSNEAPWRAQRLDMGWIATSGFDDTPHRPVNIPTSPYPQFDLAFTVMPSGSTPVPVTTRYTVASAGGWVGPWDQPVVPPAVSKPTTSFRNDQPAVLGSPSDARPTGPVPRSLPSDTPAVPSTGKIVIYVHGGESRAEEAIDMANHFITEAAADGDEITVISLDLANSGYSSRFPIDKVASTPWDYHEFKVFDFDVQWVIDFIEKLDASLGNISNRIAAVIGGSLGGNTTLKLATKYDAATRAYLRTIVSWSVTATAPAVYLGVLPAADVAILVNSMQQAVSHPEPFNDHITEAAFIEGMYAQPLSKLLGIPPQPVTWYRGGYGLKGDLGWQPCKDFSITNSRYDRYETYSPFERQWTVALDLEQIAFSYNDVFSGTSSTPKAVIDPDVDLMLVAGEQDNYFPNAIYNSTIDLARVLRDSAHGRAEFWLDTGHSIHNERPTVFVQEIRDFIANPRAVVSRHGTPVAAAPKARYSEVDK